jgi:VWFA-related protein
MNTNTNIPQRALVAMLSTALFLVPVPLRAQETPAPEQAPTLVAPDRLATAPLPEGAVVIPQGAGIIKKESKLVLVDAVVTDKKGNYVHDLTQKDFKVYEDNKEQQIASFSNASDAAIQANNAQRHYLILFFDNSSMAAPDQIQARAAATKFIDANAAPDHLMAVVNFGGKLRIAQNFTANAEVLRGAVGGFKSSTVASNASPDGAAAGLPSSPAFPAITSAETDFGSRTMLLALRGLAKNLRAVPGRKMLVLFSSGFTLTPETESELIATIDACNKANVAIYSLDVRGLNAPIPAGGSARNNDVSNRHFLSVSQRTAQSEPRLMLASWSLNGAPDPQRPVGGGNTGGGGGRPTAGGGAGGAGGTGGTGGRGGAGGTGGKGGAPAPGAGAGGKPGGTPGTPGGTRTGTTGGTRPTNYNPYNNYANNPYNQSRSIIPQFPPSTATNQQVLAALADGTGGFTIFNTNDLLGGLQRIGKEQNEFYVLGYVPGDSPEGSCHTLKVKMNRGGLNVRARSGFCNARTENPLEGKPAEKQLELHAAGGQAGSIRGALAVPYFYSAPNVARVNLAMEIPSDALKFDKEKGKYHANINVLGIAYRPDGTVGARFSDTVNLDLEKDEWKEFTKTPYRYQNQFDAAAGTYKLTVVLSGGADTFGKFESPLQIDSYDGKSMSLGGIALTNSATRISDIPSGLDSILLEDRTPLVVKGMQVVPSATNRFKRSDNVILYTEIYDPLLASDQPPKLGFGYHVLDRATNKEVIFTGAIPADDFVQKGNPLVPAGMVVKVKDLPPGGYRLLLQAVDSAKNHAPNRTVDFDVTD